MQTVQTLLPWGGFFAGLFALIRFVRAVFNEAERLTPPQTKAELAASLTRLDVRALVLRWPTTFSAVFDSVFGRRHLSWRCFRRSCIASVAASAVLLLTWFHLRPADAREWWMSVWSVTGVGSLSLLYVAAFLLTIGFVFDYASLLETRWIIGKMTKALSFRALFGLLAIDVMLSAVIAWVGIRIATTVFYWLISLFIVNVDPYFLLPSSLRPQSWATNGVKEVPPPLTQPTRPFVVVSPSPAPSAPQQVVLAGRLRNWIKALRGSYQAILLGHRLSREWEEITVDPPQTEAERKSVDAGRNAAQKMLWHSEQGYWALLRMPSMEGPRNLIRTTASFYPMGGFYPSPGVWFYAAFFTTAWSLIYLLAALALRFVGAVWWFGKRLDIQGKPLESLGFVSAWVAGVVYVALSLLWFVGNSVWAITGR
jgi:hypothetical protein